MEIRSVASGVLSDAETYLKEINSEAYKKPLDLLSGASIGQHTRHFLEFYQCLFAQMETDEKVIDYSKRQRDHSIEQDPQVALQAIGRINAMLAELNSNERCSLKCPDHMGENGEAVDTNLNRELLWNIEHTIHHMALIKIGIRAADPSIELPEHFGVAPSTIQHQQACAQ